mmetsp:Transcript_38397/g.94399  ORF Transcript_38397/g.94399 Transcript_38397/m.94399 type:complete len:91 (-) Transcript_38397:21-293(-)
MYLQKGRLSKALRCFEEVLCERKATHGKDHPDITNAIGCIAQVYEKQGRHVEALSSYRETLQMQKKTLGHAHPKAYATLLHIVGGARGGA